MASEITSSGTKLFVGPAGTVGHDKATYDLVVWTEVGKLVNAPDTVGEEYAIVESQQLGNRLTVKAKDQINPGSISVTYDHVIGDAGQGAMAAAKDSDAPHPFKLELKNGELIYFQGLVTRNPTNVGAAGNFVRRQADITLTTTTLGPVAP